MSSSPLPLELCVCALFLLFPLSWSTKHSLFPLSVLLRGAAPSTTPSPVCLSFSPPPRTKAKPKPSQSQAKAKPKPSQSFGFCFPLCSFCSFLVPCTEREPKDSHRANKAARDDRTGSGFSKTPHKFLPSFLGFVFFHIPDAFAVCTILFHLKPLLLDTKKRERESAHHHIARRSWSVGIAPLIPPGGR